MTNINIPPRVKFLLFPNKKSANVETQKVAARAGYILLCQKINYQCGYSRNDVAKGQCILGYHVFETLVKTMISTHNNRSWGQRFKCAVVLVYGGKLNNIPSEKSKGVVKHSFF